MKAYRLILFQVHATGTADAFPVDEASLRKVRFKTGTTRDISEPVRLRVHHPLQGETDMPLTTIPMPLMSARVADTLVKLMGAQAARRYSVQLVDRHENPIGALDDFVILQALTVLDAIDLTSPDIEVQRAPGTPYDGAIFARRPALVRPDAGFPAYFHVTRLEHFGPFFSEAARTALEAIKPRGFKLVEVPTRAPTPPHG